MADEEKIVLNWGEGEEDMSVLIIWEGEEELAEEARALTVTGIVCSHVGVTGLHRSPL